MNAKEELVNALDLALAKDCNGWQEWLGNAADELIKAGWHKPRTVTDVRELDGLPVGAVVLDAFGATCTRISSNELGWRRVTTATVTHWHAPHLPATALHEPGITS